MVSATAVWAAFVVLLVEEITLYQGNAFFPLEYLEIPLPSRPPSVSVENWSTGYQKLFHTTFPQEEYFHCATEIYECFKAHPAKFCEHQRRMNTNGILPSHCPPNSFSPDTFGFLLTACAYWQVRCKAWLNRADVMSVKEGFVLALACLTKTSVFFSFNFFVICLRS